MNNNCNKSRSLRFMNLGEFNEFFCYQHRLLTRSQSETEQANCFTSAKGQLVQNVKVNETMGMKLYRSCVLSQKNLTAE